MAEPGAASIAVAYCGLQLLFCGVSVSTETYKNDRYAPIVLKNYSLIVAQAADSICLLDRGICDVGTKAGGTGSTVL